MELAADLVLRSRLPLPIPEVTAVFGGALLVRVAADAADGLVCVGEQATSRLREVVFC